MKQQLTILFTVIVLGSVAQNNSFVKYFDSTWKPCTKENASFYTEFEKLDTVYKCTSYYLPSKKLFGKSTYYDTLFRKATGLTVRFFESGIVSDSAFYNEKSMLLWFKEYYPSGKIKSIVKVINGKPITEGYDEDGKPMELYTVIQMPPEFNGGLEKWKEFLEKNLKWKIPLKNKAPAGKYTVILKFSVDEEGNLSNIIAENDPGFGTKEEAIRVLSKSPKWKPATQNGKAIKYNHKQSITFLVSDQ